MVRPGPGESPMDLQELEELINLMNENGLSLLEVEEDGKHYRLEKGTLAQPMQMAQMPQMPSAPLGASLGGEAGGNDVETARRDNSITFNSPMVGTFYRASSPEHEPFAKAGERVDAETVICIIEAMKVFNEIKAEMSGTVVEVLAENAEAVEYGQPLFLIRPD